MSWPATFGVALLAGAVGMVTAGFIANQAVTWYRISSFEGYSGYFVVFMGLCGLVAGFVIGVVAARMVTGGFLAALAAALGIVLGIALLVGGPARLFADVPPRIGGDTLLLALEYRWPAAQVAAPSAGEHEPHVRLGSVNGSIERKGAVGPLWLEDSRFEDGRWVSPAAVAVFTERGKRVVAFIVDDSIIAGALVPLPRRPRRKHLEWSDWRPAHSPDTPDGASYRFRVHRASESIRAESSGPFDIEMAADGFSLTQDPAGTRHIAASATFAIRHRGNPVIVEHPTGYESTLPPEIDRARAVAVVAAPRPALLACMDRYDRPCFLLISEEDGLRSVYVGELPNGVAGYELTSDSTRFALSRMRTWSAGRLERDLFEEGRLYHLGMAVLDTREPSLYPVKDRADLWVQRWEAPVSLSPDLRSFVSLGIDRESEEEVLAVSDIDGGNEYAVAIDRAHMPYETRETITPAWVLSYFEWVRKGDGVYRLERRSD
jgi:hypothetical protein